MRIPHIVEESIFGSDQQVGDTIAVPVHNGWAGGVAGEDTVVNRAYFFKYVTVVAVRNIAIKEYVSVVEQQVEFAVTVPVGEAEFASAAADMTKASQR